MSQGLFQKAAVATTATVASFAVLGAIQSTPVQAATLNLKTTFSVTGKLIGDGSVVPVSSGFFDYTKTIGDPGLGGLVGYKLQSFLVNLFPTTPIFVPIAGSYTDKNPGPLPGLNAFYTPSKYAGILPSFLYTNNKYDYVGDGDYPPPDGTYSTSGGDYSSLLSKFGFSEVDVTVSTVDPPTTAAVPEPTTMAGLALASSGLAAARRKRKQVATV